MECPRCGGTVTIYQLGDRESYVCDDCEYVGIDVEHGAEPEELESWDEALSRFHERFAGDGDDETGGGEADGDGAPENETGDDGTVEEVVEDAEAKESEADDSKREIGEGLTPAIVRVDADVGGS